MARPEGHKPKCSALSEETRWRLSSARTNARERRSERTEWTGKAASSSEEPEATRRPARCSHTREREEPRPNPGENTQERTGTKQTELNHGENWKTPPSREPPKFSSRKGATGSDSKPTDQRRKKSPLPSRDSAEATDLNLNGVNEHIRLGERKRSPGADPSDDPSTRKRDEWKASTRTEGDSKVPSTLTCRKAVARGKHTGNVITTPGSVRGEEERLERAPGNRPEERMGPQDSASLVRHRQSGGRATSKAERRNNPMGRTSPAPRPLTLE